MIIQIKMFFNEKKLIYFILFSSTVYTIIFYTYPFNFVLYNKYLLENINTMLNDEFYFNLSLDLISVESEAAKYCIKSLKEHALLSEKNAILITKFHILTNSFPCLPDECLKTLKSFCVVEVSSTSTNFQNISLIIPDLYDISISIENHLRLVLNDIWLKTGTQYPFSLNFNLSYYAWRSELLIYNKYDWPGETVNQTLLKNLLKFI